MKTNIILALVLMFITTSANASQYNEGVKKCLQQLGYRWTDNAEERINNFNWNNASICTNSVQRKLVDEEYTRLRDFIKENPWYKGPNWKWERYSEYNCSKVWSEEVNTTITLCQKDYYVQ